MRIYASTWEALHSQTPYELGEIECLNIYIDGSASNNKAAWALVVVSQGSGGYQFRGCISGLVCTDREHENGIGAADATNITAEVSALIIAQAYALTVSEQIPVCIWPDLHLSKQIICQEVALKKDCILNQVSLCLSAGNSGYVLVQEVRAHQQHPWNELADCLANIQ